MKLINEQEYRDLFLNETMHYPDEMNHIFALVFNKAVGTNFSLMAKFRLEYKMYTFKHECEYFNNITFLFSFYEENDIDNSENYHGSYKNEYDLEDAKIQNPTITLEVPRTENWEINLAYIEVASTHELTHLYDDWQNMIHGNLSLFNSKPNQDMLHYKQNTVNSKSFIVKAIAEIAYFISKSESPAFYAQTYHELKALGCNHKNYHDKLKETVAYKGVVKNRDFILSSVDSADKEELISINTQIHESFPNMKMYSMGIENFDRETYLTKFKSFIERECRRFMNNYGSVVQLYIDDFRKSLIGN